MSEPPTVDDRRHEALLAAFEARSEEYTPTWSAESADAGTTLLEVGARFESALRQRLDQVPEKHRLAMLDELGFGPRPPRAARLPLTVEIAAGLDRNVPIPTGTRAVAESDAGTQWFETSAGFEATPASLTAVYAVDPSSDRLFDHTEALLGDSPIELFDGPGNQSHQLYLCHEDLLRLESGARLAVTVDTEAPAAFDHWEYYGEDGSGTVGWHPLSPVEGATSADRAGELQVSLRLRGATRQTAVDGREGRWIRCRSDGGPARVRSIELSVERDTTPNARTPDSALADDVPLGVAEAEEWHPFGRRSQPPSTLYLAAEEPFSKPGASVELSFLGGEDADAPTDRNDSGSVLDGPPALSWEYWNGHSWTRLPLTADGTDAFRTAGDVRFQVPEDLQPTAMSGQENHWIRARLVGGSYGPADDSRGPSFEELSITYEVDPEPVSTIRTRDNGSITRPTGEAFDAFEPLPDADPAVYLGFDAPLRGGPLTLLVDVDGDTGANGRCAQWECSTAEGWAPIEVDDGTAGLCASGILEATLPGETTAVERFGDRRHWLRCRLINRPDGPVETPVLSGIYPNTQWADNVRTVEREVLGSSDGEPDQRMSCGDDPILDVEVWVEESNGLSARQRQAVLSDDHQRVATDGDTGEELWIRWTETSTLRGSESEDRHYVLDGTDGTIEFGDGRRGAIPPSGQGNVRATYRTGGGSDGDVPRGAIDHLESASDLVDSVYNPRPGDGGAPSESSEAVTRRAGSRLRTRERAVTPRDFAAIAEDEVRDVAAAACPGGAGQGVDVVIVPESSEQRPRPSAGLEERVHETLGDRAPATVTGSEHGITVRGPTYAPVSVEAGVTVEGHTSARTVEDVLTAYCHPLDGGDNGWAFGTVPTRGALSAAISGVEGVQTVTALTATVDTDGTGGQELARMPSLPADALVCSGAHTITVRRGGQDGD